MNVDEIRKQWAEHDRKLEENIRLNRRVLAALQIRGSRAAMYRLVALTSLHAAAWLVCAIALGSFIYGSWSAPRFAAPGIAVDVYVIGIFIALIRQIALAAAIDYGKPVAAIQKQFETLRIARIRTTQWGVLLGVLAWTPFVIVALQAWFGLDAYALLGPAYLTANVVFAITVLAVSIWIAKKFGPRLHARPFVKRFLNDLAGHNLNAAQTSLRALARFESEN